MVPLCTFTVEIHELHNIGVNLYADINRELLDELYIADASHRRQMSKMNVHLLFDILATFGIIPMREISGNGGVTSNAIYEAI